MTIAIEFVFRYRSCTILIIKSSRVLLPLYATFFRPNLEYAVHASYTATHRHWKRCIEARSEVCERASAMPHNGRIHQHGHQANYELLLWLPKLWLHDNSFYKAFLHSYFTTGNKVHYNEAW